MGPLSLYILIILLQPQSQNNKGLNRDPILIPLNNLVPVLFCDVDNMYIGDPRDLEIATLIISSNKGSLGFTNSTEDIAITVELSCLDKVIGTYAFDKIMDRKLGSE